MSIQYFKLNSKNWIELIQFDSNIANRVFDWIYNAFSKIELKKTNEIVKMLKKIWVKFNRAIFFQNYTKFKNVLIKTQNFINFKSRLNLI